MWSVISKTLIVIKAVIGFSLPTYLFWLSKGCPRDYLFYEGGKYLGNWAPLYHEDRAFESACHILSLPDKKIYKKMIELGFDLIELKPQPLLYDYNKNEFSKYFKFRDSLYYAKQSFIEYSFVKSAMLLNLFNQKFYYFNKGSFEITINKNIPPIVNDNVSSIIIGDSDIKINEESFESVYVTPGMILTHYDLFDKRYPFSFKQKQSTHSLIYVPRPNFDLSYIRINGHKSLFRLSK